MSKLRSRKFWLAVVGIVLPLIADITKIEILRDETLIATTATIIAYIAGEAAVDIKRAGKHTEV